MKVNLAISLAGFFSLNEEGTVVGVRYFKTEPELVAEQLCQLDEEELPKQLEQLLQDHKEDEIVIQKPSLARIIASKGYQTMTDVENPNIDRFHLNFADYAVTTGLFPSPEKYYQFAREVGLLVTRERVRKAAEKRDRLIVHAIETIDDLDKTLNLFSGRLREFYGMHFPELVDAIDNHLTFAKIVAETGDKEKISKSFLVDDINLPEKKAQKLLDDREKSMGSKLLSEDIDIIRDQAKTIVTLFDRRQTLEKWMEQSMKAVAPNICGLVGPLLGARLMSLAGGLKELAVSPSSKIQVLGAEKALYRTIKTGAPPPKHGIIFQDPRLNQSKWWQRGKIARVIASKLSIAARMDYFDAEDRSEEFGKELNEKIAEIKDKYPDPPQEKKRPSTKKSSRRKKGQNKGKRHSKK
jgi:nucleolar protein 56